MKPCLVIGSGFHSWVLGKNNTALSNWNKLIDDVAESLLVATPSHTLNPVLRWEKLLEIASNDGFRPPAQEDRWIDKQTLSVFEIEPHAKNAVKAVLDKFSNSYPSNSARAKYPIQEVFGSVISLNFDHCWLGKNGVSYHPGEVADFNNLSSNEIHRLRNYVSYDSQPPTKIWQPNGSVLSPKTIRMGLYDYGSKPYAINAAFKQIKSFEKSAYKKIKSEKWQDYEQFLEKEIQANNPSLNTWVTDFLYRPIYFAGTGLSDSEIGLWWLLAQRARNFAKLSAKDRPPTVVLVSTKDERRDFWANRPCGVETLTCADWDIGWEMIMDKVTQKTIDGGTF